MTDVSISVSADREADLSGQVALVTGSSRGIGAAIAIELARRGAAVAVHGRDREAVSQVASAIRDQGGDAIQVIGDLTRADELDAIRVEIEQAHGPVSILVANAGASLTPPGALEEITEEGWQRTIDANLLATFLTLRCFLPGMKQRGRGTIITISSSAGRQAHGGAPLPYAAAKAAIVMLTQQLAAQVGPSGIRVNCIAPETILTAHNQSRIPAPQQQRMAQHHPLRRLGTPEDVAHAAAFLASEQSAWMTGAVLDITGGAVMP